MNDPQKSDLLYVINHIDWFWSHRLPLAKGAQDEGWKVSVAVPHARNDQALSDEGFEGIDLPDPARGNSIIALIKTIFSLRALLKRRGDFTCVHTITLKYAFMTGLASLGLRTGARYVHTIAGLGYLFSSEGMKPRILRRLLDPLLKLALRRSDIDLIFQNPDDMEILIKRGLADKSRVHLIKGSGVDIDAFKPVPLPAEQTQRAPLVLMPTRLVHDKGVAVFIEAANLLRARGVKARCQIAGGISANNPLAISQTQMEDMIKGSACEWLGRADDMPALFAQATLIAYPSYYREGVPKVLLEAAAMGKAIVTTDHPGCREAVHHGDNGLLVPIKNAQALANAIEDILDDEDRRTCMEQASRARAQAEFDVRKIVEATLKIYKI